MEKEFEKSFEEIYENVYNSSYNRLKDVKSKNNRFILVVTIVAILINILVYLYPETRMIVTLTIALSICLILILIISGNQNYKLIYKNCVIEGLVKGYNNKFYYDPKIGITKAEYGISHFDPSFESYYSEDRIYGTLESEENFQIAEVVTYDVSKYKDSNGEIKEEKTQLFRGIYGIVRLKKNVVSKIYIANDSSKRKFSKNRVEMDSAEFEEYYDCITQDKITAMRIFTSDLIEKYLEIAKNNKKYKFELKIEDNMMYFRYKCGQVFEPPTFKTGLDKELLKRYYEFIYYPLEIMKNTVENINNMVDEG